MEKCDKCLTEQDIRCKYSYAEGRQMKHVALCYMCDVAYGVNLLPEFMKEDFGKFPVSDVSREMINARRKRALGTSPWDKLNGDDKGQDVENIKCLVEEMPSMQKTVDDTEAKKMCLHQPERSKREDHLSGCGALNTQETE